MIKIWCWDLKGSSGFYSLWPQDRDGDVCREMFSKGFCAKFRLRHAACGVYSWIICSVTLSVSSVCQCVAVCASSVWPDIFCNIMRRAVLLLTSECWPMSRRWNSGHRVCQYGGEGTLALIWTAAKTYQPSLNLRLKSLGLLPRKSIPIQKGANSKTIPTKLLWEMSRIDFSSNLQQQIKDTEPFLACVWDLKTFWWTTYGLRWDILSVYQKQGTCLSKLSTAILKPGSWPEMSVCHAAECDLTWLHVTCYKCRGVV